MTFASIAVSEGSLFIRTDVSVSDRKVAGVATSRHLMESSTITFKKTGGSWQAVLINVAVTRKAITPH
jgi:hypothetical protein